VYFCHILHQAFLQQRPHTNSCTVLYCTVLYCTVLYCTVPIPCPKSTLYLQVVIYEFLLILKLELLVVPYLPVADIGLPYFNIEILRNVIPCNLVSRFCLSLISAYRILILRSYEM